MDKETNIIIIDGVKIDSKYSTNIMLITSIIPNRKVLPYYRALKRYLNDEFVDNFPELESEYVRKIELLGMEDQIITDAFLNIIDFSISMLENSDITITDLTELELQEGFNYINQQFIS